MFHSRSPPVIFPSPIYIAAGVNVFLYLSGGCCGYQNQMGLQFRLRRTSRHAGILLREVGSISWVTLFSSTTHVHATRPWRSGMLDRRVHCVFESVELEARFILLYPFILEQKFPDFVEICISSRAKMPANTPTCYFCAFSVCHKCWP